MAEGENILRREQAEQRERRGHLGAVQQRQPFLRAQGDRLEPGAGQRFGRRDDLAVDPRLADPDQGSRHMGQRRQIAGSADRSLRGDAGIDPVLDQFEQRLDQFPAHPGMAAGQTQHLQHHGQADRPIIQQRAGARRMGQHDVALQFGQMVFLDPGLGQLAEARIDAIDGLVGGDDVGNRLRACLDIRPAGRIEGKRRRGQRDRSQCRQGWLAAPSSICSHG